MFTIHRFRNCRPADRANRSRPRAGKLGDHAEDIARLLTLEQGKPLGGLGSRLELGGAQAWAGFTGTLGLPVKAVQDDDTGRVELHRKPVGVVGSITPWNWPVMIAIWHILPALRAGNTVVIKPSPFTPLSTLRTVEFLNSILPKGLLNVVTSDDRAISIGAVMSAHPGIAKIVFTWSCATGEKIRQTAARTMKRLTLEHCGNDAGIVLPDCDPAAIAEGLFWGAFINNGQTCVAMKRLYVHDSIHDAVCDALVAYARNVPTGNGLTYGVALGPINNWMHSGARVLLIESGRRETHPWIHIPPTFFKVIAKGRDIVAYVGQKGEGVNNRDSIVLQGHVIVGSSVNAMPYVRGHANDTNQWAQLGNRGWSYEDVLPVFRDLEGNMVHSDAFHGTEGELHVSEPRFQHPLSREVILCAGHGAAGCAVPRPAVHCWLGRPRAGRKARDRHRPLLPAAEIARDRVTAVVEPQGPGAL